MKQPSPMRPARRGLGIGRRLVWKLHPHHIPSLTRPASFYPNQECQTSAETATRGEAPKPVYESVIDIQLKKDPLLQLANGRKEQFKI